MDVPFVPPMTTMHSDAGPPAAASLSFAGPASVPHFPVASRSDGTVASPAGGSSAAVHGWHAEAVAPSAQHPVLLAQNRGARDADAASVLSQVEHLQQAATHLTSTGLTSGSVSPGRVSLQVMLPEAQLSKLLGSVGQHQYMVEHLDGHGLLRIEGDAGAIHDLLAVLAHYLERRQAVVLRDAEATILGRYIYEPETGHLVHTSLAPIGGGASAFALFRLTNDEEQNLDAATVPQGEALTFLPHAEGNRAPLAALLTGTALPLQEKMQPIISMPASLGGDSGTVSGAAPVSPVVTEPQTPAEPVPLPPVSGGGSAVVVNTAPVAVDDAVSASEDTAMTLRISDLLLNDYDTGQPVGLGNFTLATTALHGTLVNNGNGTLTYTPHAGYYGADSFTYMLTDNGGLTDTATVNLTVTHTNHAPVASDATFAINENSANGTVVGTVAATDVDAGDTLAYAITAGNGLGAFVINSATGQITVADTSKLDYESVTNFVLTVTVSDNGAGALSDTAVITINLNDLADTAITDSNAGANTVVEGAANGAAVGVTAFAGGLGGTVSYSLTNNAGGRFAINATTGVVTVADGTLLDYETATSHAITVQASNGVTNLTQGFTVNVSNANPSAISDSNAAANSVAENAAIGTVVGVTALSSDVNGPAIAYSLTNSAGGKFAIDATTGVVTVAAALDYETATSHTITVQASDGAGGTSSQNFTISVTDVNDAPTLTGLSTSVTFLENTVNASAQVIDNNVTLADVDSSDFSGGSLTLSWQGGGLAQDSLSLSTAGTVSIVGADVRVGGVSVGALTGNGTGGANFVISFTSGATPARIDTLLEAVSYANSSDTPTASRTLSLTLTDGSGGITTQNVTVNVTPEADDQLITGTAASETLTGGTGNDTIVGLASSDTLVGNDGNDILWGGMDDASINSFNLTTLSTAPNLKLWLDGNDLDGDGTAEGLSESGLTGSAVGTWADKSGTGNNATIGGGASQPTYSTASVNGKSSLSFDGGDYLQTALLPSSTSTIIAVSRVSNTNAVYIGAMIPSGERSYLGVNSTGSNGAGVGNESYTLIHGSQNLSNNTLSAVKYDGTTVDLFWNGLLDYQGNQNGTVAPNLPYFIGTLNITGGPSNFTQGVISEILIYNTALSTPDRQSIELYLAQKWGLNITTDNDFLSGGNGSDTLYGGTGNDTLDGGANADTLIGGAGADSLVGGLAADWFRFTSTTDSGTGTAKDTIADFSQAQGDKIDLSSLGVTLSIHAMAAFTSPASFGQIRWVQSGSDTLIQIDTNGNTTADMEILLQNFTATNLSESDFLLPSTAITYTAAAAESIFGGAGNDSLKGSATNANDVIYGWSGNDTMNGDDGNDTIYGGDGNDSITDASGYWSRFDVFYGGNGNDTLQGMNHYDDLFGENGNDSLDGGGMDDTLEGGAGSDTLTGGNASVVYGDIFVFSDLAHSTVTSPDLITDFTNGVDKIALHNLGFTSFSNFEVLSFAGGITTLTDSDTGFTITFTGDVTAQLDDSDFYFGLLVRGTSASEILNGTATSDLIKTDPLTGGSNDTVYAGAGNDMIIISYGNDTVYCGDGDDTVNLYSSGGATGNDRIYGENGNDNLNGFYGNDNIDGGAGSDSLEGFAGKDTLTGGSGSDIFIFAQPAVTPSTLANPDLITDFENGIDRIQLTGFGFTSLSDFETLSFSGGITTLADTQTSFAITFTGDVRAQLDNTDFIW